MRGAPVLGLLVALALALFGCEREPTPPLIQVLELSPREVELGDRIAITGVGFPEGKTAHVSFRGDLHRPGCEAVRGAQVDVDGVVANGSELEVPLNEALERLFVGSGDRPLHTTFDGEVVVAFAGSLAAAPPVVGTLEHAWLDVRPPTHQATAAAEAAEGARTLAFLGVAADPSPVAAGGLRIQSVKPGSRGEAARLLSGDLITEWNGVRVLSVRDVLPIPGDRFAWLRLRRRGSSHEDVAQVSLVGLTPAPALALLGPVLVLGLAAVFLLLFFSPTFALAEWIPRRISARLRGPGTLFPLDLAPMDWLIAATVSAMYAFLPLVHAAGVGDVDVGVFFVITTISLAMLALTTGGARTGGRYSFREAVRVTGRTVSLQVPAALALVAGVTSTGSLRLEDIVRAQGGWPHGFCAFESPLALGLLVLWLATQLVQQEGTLDDLPEAERRTRPVGKGPRSAFSRAERANRFVTCGLAAAVFLGGWQLPGAISGQADGRLFASFLGVCLFVGKAWVLVAAVRVARQALPIVPTERVAALAWRALIPLSVVLLLLTALWRAWGPGPGVETVMASVTLVVVAAAAVHVSMRIRHLFSDARPEPHLDPFV